MPITSPSPRLRRRSLPTFAGPAAAGAALAVGANGGGVDGGARPWWYGPQCICTERVELPMIMRSSGLVALLGSFAAPTAASRGT